MKTERIFILFLIPIVLVFTGFTTGWKTFKNKKGNFSVKMPGKPVESSSSQETAAGVVEIYMYMYTQGEEQLYMVGYNDFPPSLMNSLSENDRKNMLQGGKQGAMGALSGYGDETVVDKEESFLFQKQYTALKFRAHNGEHYCNVLCFLKDNRLYQVWEVNVGEYKSSKEDNVFFDSFKLLKG